MKVKRVHVLGGLLAALLAAAGVLYSKGYWDKWEDKRAEVVSALKAEIAEQVAADPTLDAQIAEEYAECVGNGVVDAVVEAGCPLKGLDPALPQIKECAQQDQSADLMVMLTVLKCTLEANAKAAPATEQ